MKATEYISDGMRLLLLCWSLMCIPQSSIAQLEADYIPYSTYEGDGAKILAEQITAQFQQEIATFNFEGKREVTRAYKNYNKSFSKQIKEGWFIQDDHIERQLQLIMERLINGNDLQKKPQQVVLSKSPHVNALCIGQGTFTVTVGLLSKVHREGELAFTLAHEIAHYELDHVKKRAINYVNSGSEDAFEKEQRRIVHGKSSVEGLEELRKLAYSSSSYSRNKELQADSLGIIIMHNAGYNILDAVDMLSILQTAETPWVDKGVQIFLPLSSKSYPFKEKWLRKRLGIYEKQSSRTFVYNIDSIGSHPEFRYRKQRVKKQIERLPLGGINVEMEPDFNEVKAQAMFETMRGALFAKAYDRCLFMALQLKELYPKNSYLNTLIPKVLLEVSELKSSGLIKYYLPKYTGAYHPTLRLVNHFLFNVESKELSEIAFHYLSETTNFNKSSEEQYYLFWKAAHVGGRAGIQEEIRQVYLSRFEKGKFLDKMK